MVKKLSYCYHVGKFLVAFKMLNSVCGEGVDKSKPAIKPSDANLTLLAL